MYITGKAMWVYLIQNNIHHIPDSEQHTPYKKIISWDPRIHHWHSRWCAIALLRWWKQVPCSCKDNTNHCTKKNKWMHPLHGEASQGKSDRVRQNWVPCMDLSCQRRKKEPREYNLLPNREHIETTTAYRIISIESHATIDCSTLEEVTGVLGRIGHRFILESGLTRGNMKRPKATSSCHFPSRLNLNQSGGRGWNLAKQKRRIAITSRPSANIKRIYSA